MDFKLVSTFQPQGDQPPAIKQLVEGVQAGIRDQVLLGVTGSGKTFTVAKVIEAINRPTLVLSHNKTLAAQLYQEFKNFFPENRGRVLRLVLRLLPARGVHPADRSVHREGDDEERRDRQAAARRDQVAVRAPGRHHRRLGVLHLRHRRARAVLRHAPLLRARHREADDRVSPPPDGDAVRAHAVRSLRGSFRVRGDVLELWPAYEDDAVRIEFFGDEIDKITRIDPVTGRTSGREYDRLAVYPRTHYVTPRQRLLVRDGEHPHRARRARCVSARQRSPAGSPAAVAAHAVRSRDDRGAGVLQRDRELLASSQRPPARGAAADADRLLPERLPDDHRRVASDRSAGARHVGRRPLAQRDARRIRLPAAERHRQPPAELRRVRREAGPDHLRLRDAGTVRDGEGGRPLRGAGDPPDRTSRSADHHQAGQGAGRRSDRRHQGAHREERARHGHDAHQADGRGSDAVSDGAGDQGELPPLRRGDARAHRDPARLPHRRLRRADRHQPPARRTRHSGVLRGGGARRGQGRVPPFGHVADSDDRPRRAKRERRGRPVRRQDDRLAEVRDRRDESPPRDSAEVQRGARHRAGDDHPAPSTPTS